MTVFCHACGSRNIRPSYFRSRDLGILLTLRFPVRCRHCRKRFAISIFKIRKLRMEANARISREEYYSQQSQQMLARWLGSDNAADNVAHRATEGEGATEFGPGGSRG